MVFSMPTNACCTKSNSTSFYINVNCTLGAKIGDNLLGMLWARDGTNFHDIEIEGNYLYGYKNDIKSLK